MLSFFSNTFVKRTGPDNILKAAHAVCVPTTRQAGHDAHMCVCMSPYATHVAHLKSLSDYCLMLPQCWIRMTGMRKKRVRGRLM